MADFPRIYKFRKDYASRMGGVRMYPCPFACREFPTRDSLIGHLFVEHELGFEEARLLAGKETDGG